MRGQIIAYLYYIGVVLASGSMIFTVIRIIQLSRYRNEDTEQLEVLSQSLIRLYATRWEIIVLGIALTILMFFSLLILLVNMNSVSEQIDKLEIFNLDTLFYLSYGIVICMIVGILGTTISVYKNSKKYSK